MVREQLINDIKEYMKMISNSNKDDILVNREDFDFTIKYDVKNKLIFVSLSCEDLTDCNHSTWCDPKKYEDTSMYDLDKLNECGLSDLDAIKSLLAIIKEDL